jgi:hypothetical protein
LIQSRIEKPELRAPDARTPTQAGAAQASCKIEAIEARKHRPQIVGFAPRPTHDPAKAHTTQPINPAASGRRQRKPSILFERLARRPSAQDSREKDHPGRLDNRERRDAQDVGQPNMRNLVAHANGMRQTGIWIELDDELRRAAVAAETRIQTMEQL